MARSGPRPASGAAGEATLPEAHPTHIGRYEIRKELGRGMMGVVYKAEDPLLGRIVALKTIHLAFAVPEPERQAFEQRFFAEARAAARLSHPGIVVVYDVGRDPETQQLYMAIEYLKGTTLETMLRAGRLEWRHALRIAIPLAEGLHHAHAAGIVHRDIKPSNVMILESGPKIMDFGIAKLATGPGTTSGQVFGSPSYMSPERAMGEPVDARGDLFSMGAVLYEMLTGERAFAAASVPEILLKVAYEQPPDPSTLVPELPRDLDYVVRRALAKAPADRYANAQGIAEDLRDLLDGARPRHRAGWLPPWPQPETLPKGRAPELSPAGGASPGAVLPAKPKGSDTAKSGAGEGVALPERKRVSLAILAGSRDGEVIVLDRPQVTIGRAGSGAWEADIPLPDPEVSRRHAVVECYGTRIVLRDLDSRNGTWVAEKRIREVELEDHAEFRVGRTRFMLILADRE